jgi:hypothetical protein
MDGKMATTWRWELYTLCTLDALFVPLIGEGLDGTAKGIALVLYVESLQLASRSYFSSLT